MHEKIILRKKVVFLFLFFLSYYYTLHLLTIHLGCSNYTYAV